MPARTDHTAPRRFDCKAWWPQVMLLALLLPGIMDASATTSTAASVPAHDEWLSRLHVDVRLDHDNQGSETVESSQRISSDADVERAGKIPVSYDAGQSQLTIIEAYTLKPDGTRIPVRPDEIVHQAGVAGLGNARSFSDLDIDVVTFPQVARGDVVTVRYRLTGRLVTLDGVTNERITATAAVSQVDARLTFDVPDGMTVRADRRGFSEQLAQHGNRKLYTWTYTGGIPSGNGMNGAVDGMISIPHVYVSTIPDYDAFGRLYWQHAKASSQPGPRAQALAMQITHGLTDPRQKASALYDWIRRNIRYVADYSGMGNWEPRPAEEVLRTGYGDCKGQAATYQAMLRSVGIESEPVLLQADRNNYVLPAVATADAFNHTITWLPSLGLYADTTASELPFGMLPYVDTGKPALLAGERVGLTRTPLLAASDMREVRSTQVTVQPDGSAQVQTVVTAQGAASETLRAVAQQMGIPGNGAWVQRALHASRYDGLGDFAFELPAPADAPVTERARTRVTRFLSPGRGAIDLGTLPAIIGAVSGNEADFSVYRPAARPQPYWCAPRHLEEHITINFPASLAVVAPANADISGAGVTWRATYETKAHQLIATRTFDVDSPTMDCPAAGYPQRKAVIDRIAASFEQQAVYMPASEMQGRPVVSR